MPDLRRVIVLVAVVALHLVLLALLAQESDRHPRSRASRDQIVMVGLPPLPPDLAVSATPGSVPLSDGAVASSISKQKARQAVVHSATVQSPSPPTHKPGSDRSAPSTESASPAPRAIDWQAELALATERQLARESQKRERAPPLGLTLAGAQPSSNWNGWDFAATHRYATTSEGRPYVNLNDHCIITFPFFTDSTYRLNCAIGNVAPHTDLFQYMKDPSETQ